jgi:hypothetical protein
MKPKRSRKSPQTTTIEGNWINTDDLVKDGESKEIAPGMWVIREPWVILDPPEPIKKNGRPKPPRRKK